MRACFPASSPCAFGAFEFPALSSFVVSARSARIESFGGFEFPALVCVQLMCVDWLTQCVCLHSCRNALTVSLSVRIIVFGNPAGILLRAIRSDQLISMSSFMWGDIMASVTIVVPLELAWSFA